MAGRVFSVVSKFSIIQVKPIVHMTGVAIVLGLPPALTAQRCDAQPCLDALVDAPTSRTSIDLPLRAPASGMDARLATPLPPPPSTPEERFHWKGLLWQSLGFLAIEHGPRIASADAGDRHLLLNKPFWSDYWASLGQYNMRRWNDGDSIKVNYIGHPFQGAISGDLEIQNHPRDRALHFENSTRYWASRGRALLWATAYSTQFEIGPISENGIFNQGGYTYPLNCKGGDTACEKTAKYTNNTGWVDFIVTPVVGTALLVAQDLGDRYISDRLIARHPDKFRCKVLRGTLNPSQSLANALRGRYPWFRDYDEPLRSQSRLRETSTAGASERRPPVDISPFYSSLSLPDNDRPCRGCRLPSTGVGIEAAVRIAPWLDAVTVLRTQQAPGSLLPQTTTGSLQTAHFGFRSGIASRYAAVQLSLMPGFASYSNTGSGIAGEVATGTPTRRTAFSALVGLSGEIQPRRHVGFRVTVEQMILRYESPLRDPPGRGTPPRLSFLSHENYINSTNWGVRFGPVVHF